MKIFIYGKQKSTGELSCLMKGATLIGEVRTGLGFKLVSLGGILGLVRAEKSHATVGELWEVPDDTLAILDHHHRTDVGLFIRTIIALENGDLCETYFLNPLLA